MRQSNPDRIKVPFAVWAGMKTLGIEPTAVVNLSRLPMVAYLEQAPISTVQYFALWRAVEELSGDPAVGLKCVSRLNTTLMPPSFIAPFHARDFRDGLHRVVRYKKLCAPEDMLVTEAGADCRIEFT